MAFGMRVDFFVKSSLRREKARNFKFKYLSERSQPRPIFPYRGISADLHRFPRDPDGRLVEQAAPFALLSVATPMPGLPNKPKFYKRCTVKKSQVRSRSGQR